MKNSRDTLSVILVAAAIMLLIAGVVLSFQGKATNITTYAAAFLCLIFSQVSRFESFEGLGLKAKVREIEETVDTIIATSTSDTEVATEGPASIESIAKELRLSHSNEASLDTIMNRLKDTRFSFRTSNGLAKDTGLSRHTVEHVVVQLHQKGYVNKAHSRSKGVLWTLSEKGKAVRPLKYEE